MVGDQWSGTARRQSSDGLRYRLVTETAHRIGVDDARSRAVARSSAEAIKAKYESLFKIGARHLEKQRRLQAIRSGRHREERQPEIPFLLRLHLELLDIRGISERLERYSELPLMEMSAAGYGVRGSPEPMNEREPKAPLVIR